MTSPPHESPATFRITDPLRFYQAVHNETGVQQRLRSIVSSTLRGALGEVSLDFILTDQRADLMVQIAKQVNAEAKGFGIYR